MRYLLVLPSIIATLSIFSIARSQNGPDSINAASDLKSPAARVLEGHQDLGKKSSVKTHANVGKVETQDPNHVVTSDEHQAIPYRPCINARGWKNGRLVCASKGDETLRQNGREVEGPYSRQ